MKWLQQLIGKLKLAVRRMSRGAQEPAPTTTARATDPAAPVTAAPESANPTAAEKSEPAKATDGEAEPAEAAADEAESATAEPEKAEPEKAEPAEAAAEATESPAVESPAVEKKPATEAMPVKKDEPADPALSTLDHGKQAAELQAASTDAKPAPAEAAKAAENGASEPAPAPPAADVVPTDAPYGPNSAKPAANGDAPSDDFAVKAKVSSKLFHTAKSPYFSRTKADVWFKSEADAEGAGFQAWDHKKRAAAKK